MKVIKSKMGIFYIHMRSCNSISSTKRQCTRNADRILCTDLSDHIDVVNNLYTTPRPKRKAYEGKENDKQEKESLRVFMCIVPRSDIPQDEPHEVKILRTEIT